MVAVLDTNLVPKMAPFLPPSVNAAFLGSQYGTFNAALFLMLRFRHHIGYLFVRSIAVGYQSRVAQSMNTDSY